MNKILKELLKNKVGEEEIREAREEEKGVYKTINQTYIKNTQKIEY